MTEAVLYDITEQLERIAGAADQLERVAGALENLCVLLKPPAGKKWKGPRFAAGQHLSFFLEDLPTWHYECLRRKLLPAGLAARFLGLTPAQLEAFTERGLITSESGRYDILNLLMWLDAHAHMQRIEQ